MKQVILITWCGDLALLYGSLLVFDTLRVGFPTADVLVIDNASVSQARSAIRAVAAKAGCRFEQLEQPLAHWQLINDAVARSPFDEVIFCDPDVVFWSAVEPWSFPEALAGRLIPAFLDPYTGCRTAARLHTSLLFTRPTLLRELARQSAARWEWTPWRPVMLPAAAGIGWLRYDTGADWWALGAGRAFAERELDCYDHLFCGSHLPTVMPCLGEADARAWGELHQAARSRDHGRLKGCWRQQEQFFAQAAV